MYICKCKWVYVYTDIHVILYVYELDCAYNWILYLCMYLSMCMYACMHACMHVCMYVCTYVRRYVCMYVCMYLPIYLSTYLSIYLSIYPCIHVSMNLCMYVGMYTAYSKLKQHVFIYINMSSQGWLSSSQGDRKKHNLNIESGYNFHTVLKNNKNITTFCVSDKCMFISPRSLGKKNIHEFASPENIHIGNGKSTMKEDVFPIKWWVTFPFSHLSCPGCMCIYMYIINIYIYTRHAPSLKREDPSQKGQVNRLAEVSSFPMFVCVFFVHHPLDIGPWHLPPHNFVCITAKVTPTTQTSF